MLIVRDRLQIPFLKLNEFERLKSFAERICVCLICISTVYKTIETHFAKRIMKVKRIFANELEIVKERIHLPNDFVANEFSESRNELNFMNEFLNVVERIDIVQKRILI